MQYYQYFRLKGPPFQPASPDAAVYLSPTHMEGLATLESGLSGELTGLTLLTGEAGTGKTTLIYSLLQRDYKRVRIACVDDPKLSFVEIMRVILSQMKLYTTGSTKLDYLEALDRLLELHGKEERIAIIVDESQVLSDEVLEELRLLSNRGQHRLQLILVGQPELAERLKKPELRQLNQRISSRGLLTPLTIPQAIKYVECKLSAQGSNCAAVFERGALKRLLRRSDGIPRKINMLCHTAMQASYNAGEKKVSYKTANKVAQEYYDSVRIRKPGFSIQSLTMPALVAGGAVAALLLLSFVRSNVWPGLASSRTGGQTVQSVRPATQVKPIEQVKPPEQINPVAQVKPVEQTSRVEQVRTVAQPAVEGHPDAGAKSNAAAAPSAPAAAAAPSRPELRASLAPLTPAPAAPKTDAAPPPATAPETRTAPIAPAPSAANVAPQKQAAVSAPAAAEQRNRITVRSGDTLEKIAIRYSGSKSGINEFIAANRQLSDINQLSVGEVVYLPPGISAKASHDETASAPPAANGDDSSEQ